ncbi:ATP-dependent DNA ligase [Phragmitibacter flavus]|uniref:ATP-dependent DNA ligase n=1 Tax=Phragmitibacter flavus TaxID=2576071 RepID=A0A5R8KJN1_9BACT|nr:non-homologous end-joining DNA ligase [Phragmitibacter flavus]TLD72526.1 ATP-dependent DNA ligase [Phragmitibacter flavus]
MAARKSTIEVENRTLEVSNLDKIYYPKTKFTKGQMIDYYVKIAPVLLPHLKSRAITLKRYPDGVEGEFFYEKQCPSHAPKWIKTTKVKKSDGEVINYCVINDLPSLVWAANIGNLELHPFTHRTTAPKRPTALVFDLDPGPPADIIQCGEVAVLIRDFFLALDLKSLVKTSGSKGLQLVVPLNTPTSYEKTKAFAHALADTLSKRFPDKIVSLMKKSLRNGKVFIDWSQNDDKKTTVCVYSLRAKGHPSVSAPITWNELEKAIKSGTSKLLSFSPDQTLKRSAKDGDLFEEVLTLKQTLPNLHSLARTASN